MTGEQQTDALVARINKAERDRDYWRGSGNQERYMEACSTVGSLEMQLERHLSSTRAAESEPRPH